MKIFNTEGKNVRNIQSSFRYGKIERFEVAIKKTGNIPGGDGGYTAYNRGYHQLFMNPLLRSTVKN